MACLATLTLNLGSADNPMDAAIYHPTRNSLFAVRAGYAFEISLNGSLLNSTKIANPCFSKSCMTYDPVNDKIWVGTGFDWASGRSGDSGGADPSLNNVLLWRLNPATLAVEQLVNPHTFPWGGFVFTGVAWIRQMPQAPNWMPSIWGPQSGFYDMLYANGFVWFSLTVGGVGIASVAYLGAFDVGNITGNNYLVNNGGMPFVQIALETVNTPSRIWVNMLDDLFSVNGPWAVNSDFSPADPADRAFTGYSVPTGGANSSVVFSPVAGGAVYMCQLNGQNLVKYNTNGTVNGVKPLVGVPSGGQNIRMRFNPNDSLIYIPFPANNQVVAFNPATDTVSAIYSTGLDGPHDCVFSTTRKFAVQLGTIGLKEIV